MYRVLVLFLIACPAQSQELISNGDFEDYRKCPQVYVSSSNYQVFVGWESLDEGTPDYYNTCGEGDVKVPRIWAGKQYPYNGNGFAGIYVWGKRDYREYLTSTLNEEITAGLSYEIRVSYALAANSPFTCDWLGIRLLDTDGDVVQTLLDFEVEKVNPKSGWITALFHYSATGQEHSLVIGNFHSSSELEIIDMHRTYVHPMLVDRAYFFIDGVSFSRPTGDGVFDNMAPNNPVKLENVQFEFDKSILMPSSLVSLDSLARYIKLHVDLKFLITGHTDIIGGEKYNLKLSEDRAKSVLNYLLIKGIAADRLTATGKGNSEPISGNRTDTERELNRRVTITLIEN